MEYRRPYRSLFWPILLIAVGILWLLGNMGLLPPLQIDALLRLWPVLLIVAGLDLMFGRSSPLIGAIIGVLAVTFIIVVLFAGSALGLPQAPGVVTEQFVEPLGQAQRATIRLDLGSPSADIYALADTGNLMEAEVSHYGNARMTSSGVQQRQVTLGVVGGVPSFPTPFEYGNRSWSIGLAPGVPLDLTIDSSSGGGDFKLAELTLSSLMIDSGSGAIRVELPEGSYNTRLDSSSGSVQLTVPCSSLELRIDSGSGSVTVNTPGGCPMRVEVIDSGSGSVNVPSSLTQVRGDRDEGVWESSDYASASERLTIIVEDQGSGSFNVR